MNSYNKTDQLLHLLSQTIAKANRTFVPQKPDDSHSNLALDSIGNRIVGRWITSQKGSFLLALNLTDFQFQWLNKSLRVIKSFDTVNKNCSKIEAEIESFLPEIGLPPKGFTDKMHYEIPTYIFANSKIQQPDASEINEWKLFRSTANQACTALLNYLQTTAEIRIWPHHFDTGIYVDVAEMGIGFGLAMKDTMAGAPYFYISGYPKSTKINYEAKPNLNVGKWEVNENWKGAILLLSDLKNVSKDVRENQINAFAKETADWFLQQM